MSDTKFTPGPWRAVPWSPSEFDIRAMVDGKSTQVAGPAFGANAHLIAAAPMLYEAALDTVEALRLLRTGVANGIGVIPKTLEVIEAHIAELNHAMRAARGELA